MTKRIAVGLSGGVDSSVSAYLLQQQGYELTGVYMQCWDSKADGCTAEQDRADAVAVASKLGIKFEYLDFIKEYKEKVIEYFFKEYEAGRTPNPDVMCNREIKFGLFLEWALKNGFDGVATGHYARTDGKHLYKGVDTTKDQSYFLYVLNENQLSKTTFPVGNMKKTEIRKIAKEQNLITAEKPDSVGICFIGEVDIKEFLKQRLKIVPGNVVNKGGEVIGTHEGAWFYTIGQRHGFIVTKYQGLPLYVIGKNVEKNELIVGFVGEVNKDKFTVEKLHWINELKENEFDCEVRIRHLGEMFAAHVVYEPAKDIAEVSLTNPIFAVAPGQSAVFYIDNLCLGGGVIRE
ncbi:MAG TPA: tRNA 2-thiouridine(34) synthase MnmA [Candidatus Saccharimonadales bacterium]|nr:tRNA 2-thiouridine(34) synthase MnmA [Candidatus Saccharimonadales bacterium]